MNTIGELESTRNKEKKPSEGNIGLGLALCQKLIAKMGPHDRFLVKSQEKVGSQFGFLLNKQENQPKSKDPVSQFKKYFEDLPLKEFQKQIYNDTDS